jgi:hypothetical protein
MKKLNSSLDTLGNSIIGFNRGNRKIAQVRSRASVEEIATAYSEGVELSTKWEYTPLLTQKQAVRYYNESKANPFIEVEFTLNIVTDPFDPEDDGCEDIRLELGAKLLPPGFNF